MNELLYRRVDLEDVVSAHLLAGEKVGELGFGRFIIYATSPLEPNQVSTLRKDLPSVLGRLYPDYEIIFVRKGWKMLEGIDRVCSNEAARKVLGWEPVYTFSCCLERLQKMRN